MKDKILKYLKENDYLNDRTLLVSIVGSRMWRMEHEGSDWDIFIVVNDSLEDMLSINYHSINKEFKYTLDGIELDIKIKEIKDILKQLYKNNPNFIFGVLSDFVLYESDKKLIDELRDITYKNIDKQIFIPLEGMMKHHYQKYFVNTIHNETKKKETMIRRIAYLYRALTRMKERNDLKHVIPPHYDELTIMNVDNKNSTMYERISKLKIGDLIDFVTDCDYPKWSRFHKDGVDDFNRYLYKLKIKYLY